MIPSKTTMAMHVCHIPAGKSTEFGVSLFHRTMREPRGELWNIVAKLLPRPITQLSHVTEPSPRSPRRHHHYRPGRRRFLEEGTK